MLRCCLIYLSIIIPRHFLYLLYLYPGLDLGLFMSYLCDLFSFASSFSEWLIIWIQPQLLLWLFFRTCPNIFGWWREKNVNNFQIAKVQLQGVVYYLLNFLPISALRCLWMCCLYIKEACIYHTHYYCPFTTAVAQFSRIKTLTVLSKALF